MIAAFVPTSLLHSNIDSFSGLVVEFPRPMPLEDINLPFWGMGSEMTWEFLISIVAMGLFQYPEINLGEWSHSGFGVPIRAVTMWSKIGRALVSPLIWSDHTPILMGFSTATTHYRRLDLLDWSVPGDWWIQSGFRMSWWLFLLVCRTIHLKHWFLLEIRGQLRTWIGSCLYNLSSHRSLYSLWFTEELRDEMGDV